MKASERDRNADLKKLANAFYENLKIDNCEFGAIGVDCKRPFGNSDVCGDILGIIEWAAEGKNDDDVFYSDSQKDYAVELYHKHLIPYLRKCWLQALESPVKAETEVQRMDRDDSAKAHRAIALADEIFEALGKPANVFFDNLAYFRRRWGEIRG